jgi:HAE1 family hydrophobic/amphiphilic exporter-1
MLASRWLTVQSREGPVFSALRRSLEVSEGLYLRLLKSAERHKAVTVALALASVVAGCGVASTLPFNLYEQDDLNEVMATAKFPLGTPLAVSNRAMRRMENALARHPYVIDVFAVAGSEVEHQPHRVTLNGILIPKTERPEKLKETLPEFRALLEEAVPEAEQISVGFPEYGGDMGGAGEFGALSYNLRGPDLDQLVAFSEALMAKMEADPAFVDVASSYETGRPQISLEIERDRAADLGVPASTLGRTMRTLLAGEKVGSYEEGGRRYDVRVQVLPEFRDDPANLHLVRVRSQDGQLVPMTNVVSLVHVDGPVEIQREARARTIALSANPNVDVPLSVLTRKLEQWKDEVGIEAPFELVADGSARQMAEMGAGIVFAFGLSLVAIYMVLASLFNSLTQPFTIMMSAPFSFIGGFLALKLAGMPIDMMSGIGLLVLMGLVMKNGILVVDYINQLRAEGLSKRDAILQAGPVRMRPVLMTSISLIAGLIPVVVSDSVGAEFRAPMGVITIGGLLTSTLLTLVMVPVIYSLVDSLEGAVARAWRRLVGRPSPASDAVPAGTGS